MLIGVHVSVKTKAKGGGEGTMCVCMSKGKCEYVILLIPAGISAKLFREAENLSL